MADPQLVGIVCKREHVAEARARAGSRNLVAEASNDEGVVLYYHTNPEESRLPSDKVELRLLKAKAEMMDFVPHVHSVPEQEEIEEQPEPNPVIEGAGTGAAGPAASAEAIANVVEPPPVAAPTTPALGGVIEPPQPLPGQQEG